MCQPELPDDLKLSETQVRAIVERALRAPPASTLITLAQLREIAAELDIDQSALADATRAVLSADAASNGVKIGIAESILRRASRATLGRSAALGAFAVALGVFTTFIEAGGLDSVLGRTTMPGSGSFVDVPVGILLIVLTLINAYSRLRAHKRLQFLLESVATWVGFAAGWALGNGVVTTDLATFVGAGLAGSAILAWKRLHMRAKRIRSALVKMKSTHNTAHAALDDRSHRDCVDAYMAARPRLARQLAGGAT